MIKDERKASILSAAMTEAQQHGYTNITREAIAHRASCAPGLVSHYFGTMEKLRRAVMSEAVRTSDLSILAQGLVNKHPKALRLSDMVKSKVLKHIGG